MPFIYSRSKIVKPNGATPDELENQVASYLTDLEGVAELKAELRPLQFSGAKEVRIGEWGTEQRGWNDSRELRDPAAFSLDARIGRADDGAGGTSIGGNLFA